MKYLFTHAKLGKGGRRIVKRADAKSDSVVEIKRAKLGFADARRIGQDGFKNRLQLARRTGDDLQHLRGRRLLLQRFAQFVQQPRILDGDDGLFCEIVHKLDLFVAERPHLLAVDGDRADQLILLEHRYDENGASAGYLGQGNRRWLAFDVGLLQSEVGDVLQLLGRDNAAERIGGAEADYRVAPPQRVPFQWRAVHRDDAKRVSVVQQEIAEFRLADARGILQHGLEHRLQLARRAAYDAENLGRCGLLLQ